VTTEFCSSGPWCCVVLYVVTDISEEITASIFCNKILWNVGYHL
jgi:hypothetical protein